MARPSKYETHVAPRLNEIRDWCRNGATDKEICQKLKISEDSFYEYKKKFSEFSESLKGGKEIIDAEVENSLLKRALGYDYEEVTKERNDKGELVVTKIVKKQVVPDVTAQIYWLKNRRPDKWRDKLEIDGAIEHKVDVPQNIQNLSPEALRAIAAGMTAPSTEEFSNEENEAEQ